MKKIFLLLTLLLFISCNNEKDVGGKENKPKNSTAVMSSNEKKDIREQEEKKVETVKGDKIFTDKLISNFYLDIEDNELIIEFYENQPRRDFDGKDLLKFEPNDVEGKYSWSGKKTLKFKFNKFSMGTDYKVQFSLAEYLKKDYKDLSFGLNFEKPVINDYSVNVRRKNNQYAFYARVNLSKAETKDFINSNLRISLVDEEGDRKNLQLTKVNKYGNNTYEVLTNYIGSGFDKQKLEIQLFDQSVYTYVSYNNQGLNSYKVKESNEKFKLYMNFSKSNNLDKIKDYINIEGLDKYYTKVEGKNVIVSGNFVSGQKYKVKLFAPLAGIEKDEIFEIKIPSLQPALEFKNDGVYLADVKEKKVRIKTRNLSSVKISIKKVEEHNLSWFRNNYGYSTDIKDNNRYDEYSLIRFGTELYSEKVDISDELNKWIETDIDLTKIGEKYNKKGIYLVEVTYGAEDLLVPLKDYEDTEKNKDANNNYYFSDYIYRNGRINKTVILSDIGVIAKRASERLFVYTQDISTGKTIGNAKVTVNYEDGEKIGYTNEDGVAVLNFKGYWNQIKVEKDGEISIVNRYQDSINYSMADNTGVYKNKGIDAYIYTERGVYRPGDNIYISSILFEEEKELPENIGLTMKIYTPLGKLYKELNSKGGIESLYTFEFATDSKDPTGNWRMELYMGKKLLKSQYVKVETVVPPKIRVKNKLKLNEEKIDLTVNSEYLFGAKSKGLKYNTEFTMELSNATFDNYRAYSFVNESLNVDSQSKQYREGILDEEGQANEEFYLELTDAPYKLDLIATTDVFQKDGRKVTESEVLTYDYYDSYAGIERYTKYGEIGEKISLKTALLDKDGKEENGKLTYYVYKNDTYWWWDYSSYNSYKKHFKKNEDTMLVDSGNVTGGDKINFALEEYGTYYVEVVAPNGHRAGTFVKSGYYSYGNNKADTFIKLELNKKEYKVGDKGVLSFESPTKGYAIINFENKGDIIGSERVEVIKGINQYDFDIEDKYFPGVYANVIILQNLKEKVSDKDTRLQGLQYIKVTREKEVLKAELVTKDKYKEPKEIEVEVKTDRPNSAFTLAVVDEGLLSITRYKSPNPYDYFFAKERYNINNYDNYRYILDYNKTEAYKTFTPGGGYAEAMMEKRALKSDAGVNEVKRFKSVSMFKSGVTDENGYAKVNFSMDDYMGELRFMLVATKDGSFGNSEKSAKVMGDVVLYPGLPRTLAPKDKVISNLNVFINEAKGKVGKVGVKVEGPLKIDGPSEFEVDSSKASEENYEFNIEALNETGVARVTYYFESDGFRREKVVDIAVNTPAPYLSYKQEYEVDGKKEVAFDINKEAVKNSADAEIRVSRYPLYNLYGRLQYLIRYPYGCVEQTTSSIFPQLYLDKFLDLSIEEKSEINKNITKGIERLEKFQLYNGSMAYWIDESYTSDWGTNYSYYFLIEAIDKGYYVPDYFINNLRKYQYNKSNNTRDLNMTNIYRLYIMALDENPNLNAMNYYKQNTMNKMNNTEKFLLAGAFDLAGYRTTAQNMIKGIKYEVEESYWDTTFGSALRDKAIILDVLSRLGKSDESERLNQEILRKLAGKEWYSTQTVAYSLISVSNYREIETDKKAIDYEYVIDGVSYKRELRGANETINLTSHLGKNIEIKNNSADKLYVNYLFQGKMDQREQDYYANEVRLNVRYYDDDGNEIGDFNEISRGKSVWAIYQLEKQSNKKYKNLALYQNLPSGLEIENLRLNQSAYPDWVYDKINTYATIRSSDIRDDKMIWFFDMNYTNEIYFVLKLNAVSKGEYYMPGAVVEAMYSKSIGAGLKGRDIIIK